MKDLNLHSMILLKLNLECAGVNILTELSEYGAKCCC